MTIDELRTYIRSDILNDPDLVIEADQDLLLSEMLNSLSIGMLVAQIEARTGVQVPPADITVENFSTLRCIEDYVGRLGRDGGCMN